MTGSERAFIHFVTVGCIAIVTAAVSATAVAYGALALFGLAHKDD